MKRSEWPWKRWAVFVDGGSGWTPEWFDSFEEAARWFLRQSHISISNAVIVEAKPVQLETVYQFEKEPAVAPEATT